MTTQKLPIRLRAATEDDVNFIFNSWLKSYRHSHFAKYIANETYYTEHHRIIETLLKKYTVVVACDEKDSTQILGYICAGNVQNCFVVHYVNVKHAFRNMGIGKELLNSFNHNPDVAGIYTHHTRIAERLASKYNFMFYPYLLFDMEQEYEQPAESATETPGDVGEAAP